MARALREEIEAALADSGLEVRVGSIEAPADLAPDTCFRVQFEMGRGTVERELPTGLAIAYLADEEAAVDEFKGWLRSLPRG